MVLRALNKREFWGGFRQRGLVLVGLSILWSMIWGGTVGAQDGVIAYHQGLCAEASGETTSAFKYFRTACLAANGVFDACLRLDAMAKAKGDTKTRKQALASAVMLRPNDVGARFELAVLLLEHEDYAFAEMHLSSALELATRPNNRALLHYYLGYVCFKLARAIDAKDHFEQADPLPPSVAQKRDFFLGRIAVAADDRVSCFASLKSAERGPDAAVAEAAEQWRLAASIFPFRTSIGGRMSADIGINTRPASAFLDAPGTEASITLGSIFRADGTLRRAFDDNLVEGALTVYRDQGWTTFGGDKPDDEDGISSSASRIPDSDFYLTLALVQAGYRRHLVGKRFEHELRVLAEGEVQLLDGVPQKGRSGDFESGPFGVYAYGVGGRLWWTFARYPAAKTGARFRVDGRPNLSDVDRSAIRFRWRLVHTRYFLSRTLKTEGIVGLRYDRTVHDPSIIKYDRLLPELSLDADWQSPLPRLSFLLGVTGKVNWYLNSAENEDNTFRGAWMPEPGLDVPENEAAEAAYYREQTRLDGELEVRFETQVALWKRASFILNVRYHQRISNMDNAAVPDHFTSASDIDTAATKYGYRQFVLALGLRQGF